MASNADMDVGEEEDGLRPQTNPNRQRPRVTRACDYCKSRKMKCTGKQPCAHCIKMNKTCEFKAKYTRGAAPAIESARFQAEGYSGFPKDDVPQDLNHLQYAIHPNMPSLRILSDQNLGTEGTHEELDKRRGEEYPERPRKSQRLGNGASSASFNVQEQDSLHEMPTARGDTIVNPFDYHEDAATETSVYERTQRTFLWRYNQQKTPVFMYGDAPHPEIDNSFFVLPMPELALAMVRRYFSEGAALTRFLHAPTVESWTNELLASFGNVSRSTHNNGQRAVVLMVFASVHDLMFDGSERHDTDRSFHYFHAAENQLQKETGEVRLATIQARLLQCFFLLSRSRSNQACSVLATMVNFIHTLNLHRKPRAPSSQDLIYAECAKRTFWHTYIVDKYLASSLSRPAILRDEDIDQDLPLLVDDANLLPTSMTITNVLAHSEMKASVYHIKLAKIMHKITQLLPNIRKPPLAQRLTIAEALALEAQSWRAEIAHFMDLDPVPLSILHQSQIGGLRLAYQEMLVLLFRPFLLENLEQHQYNSGNDQALARRSEEKVAKCLDAALTITKIINEIDSRPTQLRDSWFNHYCAHQAIIPLYVYVINTLTSKSRSQNSSRATNPSWRTYFHAASRCQDEVRVSAVKESFSRKSSGVLGELRLEAIAHIRKSGEDYSLPEISEQVNNQRGNGGTADRNNGDRGGSENVLSSTNFFGGNWGSEGFDGRAPGGGIMSSLNVNARSGAGSVIDRINTWGFSSLNGY